MKISILLPTYNRPDYLKECLDSILEQKGFLDSELEFIISDNSDNNESTYLLNNYISKFSNKKIIYNKNTLNIGPINNFNKLLELAKGEYFIFLSDDDKFYSENSLKILYDALTEYNVDCVCGIYENEKYKNNIIITKKQISNSNIIGFGGVLYKNYGFNYDFKAKLYCDYDFDLKYIFSGKNILKLNKKILYYRNHEEQSIKYISRKDDLKMLLYLHKKYKLFYYCPSRTVKLIILYLIIIFK